jgi:hypothetical protein
LTVSRGPFYGRRDFERKTAQDDAKETHPKQRSFILAAKLFEPIFAFVLPLALSIFAVAPESQRVSDERADKTAAHKGSQQRNIKARGRLAFGARYLRYPWRCSYLRDWDLLCGCGFIY